MSSKSGNVNTVKVKHQRYRSSKKLHSSIVLGLGPSLFAISACAYSAEIYVSPSGNDRGKGTLTDPFATVIRAQMVARKFAGRESVSIILRAGTYYLPRALQLTDVDSGSQAHPVTYRNYQSEVVSLSGGKALHLAWTPYRNGIMMAKVPESLRTDQLFVNGKRCVLARYPNEDLQQRILNGFAPDAISQQRVDKWNDPKGGFIHAMQALEWGDLHYEITGKTADGRLNYIGGWQNNRQMGMHSRYRFVENIFEELDAPNEWFLDENSHTLYYLPPKDLDLRKATVETVQLPSLIQLKGSVKNPVRHVTIQGIKFHHTARTFMLNREPLLRSDWTIYRGGALFLTGTEDCRIVNCDLEQLGGNAIFVNNYNRRLQIRGCIISDAGANGVAFVGDPNAVRSPLFEYAQRNSINSLDLQPGPKTNNYPSDCIVDDCLIYRSGRFEKQSAPIQIEMASSITARHCSIYDVPRAGINIGDGCWGGHVIEYCDIFDTVKETGDHGSFNSWGRDRYWELQGVDLNSEQDWRRYSSIPFLDVIKPITLRNNRWRCDHGWDIDLDDGSSNYLIYNNLCLNGGIKNREGYRRIVTNNILVNNTYHPHVWFSHGGDVFRNNIVFVDRYQPAGMPTGTPWGADMDYNLVHEVGSREPKHAVGLSGGSSRDPHSIVADAQFINPALGDFRVGVKSPALNLGFRNFPMDQFGVTSSRLRSRARTPLISVSEIQGNHSEHEEAKTAQLLGATFRNVHGLDDRSLFGLPDETGVVVVSVPMESAARALGLLPNDVIVALGSDQIRDLTRLGGWLVDHHGQVKHLTVIRKQQKLTLPSGK